MCAPEGDATGSRLVTVPGNMHEDGAAPALHARPLVMIDNDDDVIQVVIAPHPFGAGGVRVLDVPVVVPVTDLVAPTIVRFQRPDGHSGSRAQETIWPVEGTSNDESTNRSGAVAFALDRAPTGSPQGARKSQSADARPSSRGAHGQRADLELASSRLVRNFTGQPGLHSGHCFVSLSGDTFFTTS